jgi:hypothetical protein
MVRGEFMDKISSIIAQYIKIGDSNKPENYYSFSSSRFYSNPNDVKMIISELSKLLREGLNNIDYLVPLDHSGSPMVGYLQSIFEKPIFIIPIERRGSSNEAISLNIERNSKICLVDTNINRTSTFHIAANMLVNRGYIIEKIAVIFYNDLWENQDPRIKKLNYDENIIYLRSASFLKTNHYI